MLKRLVTHKLVDADTGEVGEALILIRSKGVGGRWMRIFQDAAERVSKKKLRGETYRVLFQLIGIADYNNEVPGTKEVSELMGMKQPSICRAYKELITEGILVERHGKRFLLPFLAWKGSAGKLAEKCKELSVVDTKALSEKGAVLAEGKTFYEVKE